MLTMKKILNPVAHFDEKKLLILGLASVALNLTLGHFLGFKMLSLLKFVNSPDGPGILALSALRAYTAGIGVLYLYGWLINRKTRLLDIVNTVLVSTIPAIVSYPIVRIPVFERILKGVLEDPQAVSPSNLTLLMLFCLIMLPFMVYHIVILLNGFKTSANIKAWYHVVLFFVILLITTAFTPYIFKL